MPFNVPIMRDTTDSSGGLGPMVNIFVHWNLGDRILIAREGPASFFCDMMGM